MPDQQEHRSEGGRATVRNTGISVLAVLGVLILVAGSVVFGTMGPRMRQRVMIAPGRPLAELIEVTVHDSSGWAARRNTPAMHPEEARSVISQRLGRDVGPPDLARSGWMLDQATDVRDLLGTDISVIRLIYRGTDQQGQGMLVAYLVPDPARWVHFDELGRQTPLLPGTRVDDIVELGRGQVLGTSILCQDGYAILIIGSGELSAEAAIDDLEAGPDGKPDENAVPARTTAMLRGDSEPMRVLSFGIPAHLVVEDCACQFPSEPETCS